MDDRELDNILKEIKNHSGDDVKAEDSLPAAAKEQQEVPVYDGPDAIKPVFEEAEPEEPIAEEPESDFVITEEPADEPEPEETQVEAKEAQPEETEESDEAEAADNDSTIILDDSIAEEPETEGENGEGKPKLDKNKKIIIALVAAIVVVALCVGAYFAFFNKKDDEPTTAAPTTEALTESTTAEPVAPVSDVNPLTGEADFNKAAIGKRPIAVVVENEYGVSSVRPQWGIDKADMIMEGETEYSTRMLFFWADYTALPEQIGSARSARPPFIRFSQLFDSIFIHAGLSHSKDNYEGADDVFKNENIDHVNLLSEGTEYFSRDKSRTSTIEHTGYFKGNNAPKLIEKYKFRTDAKAEKYTHFSFNEKVEDVGSDKASTVNFKWSDHCPKKASFYYDSEKGKYTTTDFDSSYGTADVEFENIVLLLDTTEYIVKQNYKGSGNSETYCNYNLDGGKGLVASNGTCVEINWSVENGKLVMKDSKGNEVKLNVGKTYIGYGSSNHSGSYSFE